MSNCEFDNPGDIARDISRDDLSRAEHVRREIAARRELREWEEQQREIARRQVTFLDMIGRTRTNGTL